MGSGLLSATFSSSTKSACTTCIIMDEGAAVKQRCPCSQIDGLDSRVCESSHSKTAPSAGDSMSTVRMTRGCGGETRCWDET